MIQVYGRNEQRNAHAQETGSYKCTIKEKQKANTWPKLNQGF